MRKILILAGRYLPGHKDGGPLRTLINLTNALGDEYEFYIACFDRDQGDTEPYTNIERDTWNKVGKANVWYVQPGGFTKKLILNLAKDKDIIYLTSFYAEYGYKTLLLKKEKKIQSPVVIASMGVFSKEALAQKSLKKNVFIVGCKMLHLFNGITWSVTSELEAEDVKRVMGEESKYIVAEDLPRTQVPGRTKKWENTIKICFLSRICEHKGLDILIDVLLQIKGYNMEFSIFGPIQEKEYWITCQEKLKQTELSWIYKGDVPSEEVQSVLSTQDILVLPTKSENYGHVVFEALSVGCIPIISNRTPWSLVESWNAGYVVSRTQEAFSKALTEYLSMSIEDKNEMVDHAVELAKYKVEQSKMKTGYREIFELRGNR